MAEGLQKGCFNTFAVAVNSIQHPAVYVQVVENMRSARADLEDPVVDEDALFYEFVFDPIGRDSGYSFKAPVSAKYDDGRTILYQGKFSTHELVYFLVH